jgi:hypothetical protein
VRTGRGHAQRRIPVDEVACRLDPVNAHPWPVG